MKGEYVSITVKEARKDPDIKVKTTTYFIKKAIYPTYMNSGNPFEMQQRACFIVENGKLVKSRKDISFLLAECLL